MQAGFRFLDDDRGIPRQEDQEQSDRLDRSIRYVIGEPAPREARFLEEQPKLFRVDVSCFDLLKRRNSDPDLLKQLLIATIILAQSP